MESDTMNNANSVWNCPFLLKGRTVLVTGGARGCGPAFALSCAEAGANVAIFDVIQPGKSFNNLTEKYGARTAYYESVYARLSFLSLLTADRVDVSSQQSLRNGFDRFRSDFGNALDICIPCAGLNRHGPFLELSYQDHHDLLTVNVLGLYFTTQLAAQQMVANGTQHGSIILVASIAGQRAIRSQFCSAYCGSKGAVKSMCPSITQELAPYGIRVNSISPYYARTEMTTAFANLLELEKRNHAEPSCRTRGSPGTPVRTWPDRI